MLPKDKERKAKGVNKIKILINIYLNEYENTKFNKEKVIVPFIKPSSEKIFNEFESIDIVLFILLIKLEKHISVLKRDSPIPRIANEILDNKVIDCSTIIPEKFIQIPNIISLKINCFGDSTLEYVKLENKYFKEKYKIIPSNKEFATSNMPSEDELPNILSK